jgi:hypothetical protein
MSKASAAKVGQPPGCGSPPFTRSRETFPMTASRGTSGSLGGRDPLGADASEQRSQPGQL